MRTGAAAAVAGLAGFALMCVELTAVRLLAPHFGDSAYVWTNVIGVILAALALGAFWGGRMADRQRGRGRLSVLLGVAAVLVALAPLLARPLGAFLVPAGLPLDSALPALVRGSLTATVVLFGVPALLLGTVTPMLAVILAGSGERFGRAIGTVAAVSTVGSLLGTFMATHLLVPALGCRATMWLCALLLGACALVLRPGRVAAVTTGLTLLSVFLHGGPLRDPDPGQQLLAARETPYQYLQVVREESGGERRILLKINEGLDSFHSVAVEGSAFTGGRYYDWHLPLPWLAGTGQRPAELRVLSVGDAAGTFQRSYAAAHPGAVVDGAELDPEAVRLGEEWFGGRQAAGTTWSGLDGRVAVEHAPVRYHVVLLDAYAHQVYIPAHLASREFFAAVRRRLVDGGIVSVNVGGLHYGDPVLAALAHTMAHEFGSAWAFHVPESRNFVLLARLGGDIEPGVLSAVVPEPGLAEHERAHLQGILERMSVPGNWRRFSADGAPLVDDRPELDRLLHGSYLASGDDPRALVTGGSMELGAAEQAAHGALLQRDPEGVLTAVRNSDGASSYLRLLCGDARWTLRQLHGAEAEYLAAGSLGPVPELVPVLAQRLSGLREDLGKHTQAEGVGRRNGWLALGAALLGLLLAGFLLRTA